MICGVGVERRTEVLPAGKTKEARLGGNRERRRVIDRKELPPSPPLRNNRLMGDFCFAVHAQKSLTNR